MGSVQMSAREGTEFSSEAPILHMLSGKWVLWAHLPHDTDWTIGSYRRIMNITSLEAMGSLYKALPDKLSRNCMLFLMRDGIAPRWEDPKNRDGGCFSFKVPNKAVPNVWKYLSFTLVGETLSSNKSLRESFNGITISPKKSFCIVKIWLKDCSIQNPAAVTPIPGLDIRGCIFRKHKSSY